VPFWASFARLRRSPGRHTACACYSPARERLRGRQQRNDGLTFRRPARDGFFRDIQRHVPYVGAMPMRAEISLSHQCSTPVHSYDAAIKLALMLFHESPP